MHLGRFAFKAHVPREEKMPKILKGNRIDIALTHLMTPLCLDICVSVAPDTEPGRSEIRRAPQTEVVA